MMRPFVHRIRPLAIPAAVMLWTIAPIGCVSTETHTKTLTELDAAKKTSAQQAAELDNLRNEVQTQTRQLDSLRQNLDQEATQRQAAEQQAASLTKERDTLTARSSDLQARLDGLEKENAQLTRDLGDVHKQMTDLEQQVASGNASAQQEIIKLKQQAATLEAEKARLAEERDRLRQEQSQLAAGLEQERGRLKAEEAEKARLEQERAAKEEEIRRLTRTQEELSRSLQDEIAKGNITIQRVRDRLTINMVDRVLFDSGQAQIKPAGVKVLKQVADVLKTVTDKQIRIEGHTDNVPISVRLQDRFKTNWELSTARATTVVRYLIDHGGVDRELLSAAGYADTRPVASNDSEEGRSSNRRIEIVLYPKDLSEVVSNLQTDY
jgi:chemotaxis protein MotB